MKYQQPFGISDTNASYINGDPSIGRAGSIPPAASIEYPQREVVNFISDSGITPVDTDLHQLAKSVQSGKVIFSIDSGVANLVTISPTPVVTALIAGMHFYVKIATTNTGASVMQVSGLPSVHIVHTDLTELGGGELLANQVA